MSFNFVRLLSLVLLGWTMSSNAAAHPASEPTRTVKHHHTQSSATAKEKTEAASSGQNCFPAIGFNMPSSVPSSLTNWWCNTDTEYGFVGFSYEVTDCQSKATLEKEFLDIRHTFNGRYVRLYGFCDDSGFYDNVIEAAWKAGVGVHALIWFGWDGGDEWKTRRDTLLSTLHSNPKGKFVTRAVQFGSEPLYDSVLSVGDLTTEVKNAQANLASLHIPVTISEMAYGYQKDEDDGSLNLLHTLDLIDAHMLPFFSTEASVASKSWPIVLQDLNWFLDNGNNKKIYLTENGWPSTTYAGVEPNSPSAVADVKNEQDYYKLLDDNCATFKAAAGGGVGWFAHIYSDSQEPGYGIYDTNGNLKFPFSPKTSC